MKALTICQPYAELIARGSKRVENRTWPTSYRGPLLIHAGKSREWLMLDDEESFDTSYDIALKDMAFGAVVATARLEDCVRYDSHAAIAAAEKRYPWLYGHHHANGPWCWIVTDVSRVDPVPWRGAQGLFDIDWPPPDQPEVQK